MSFDGRRDSIARQRGTVVGTPSGGLLAITFPKPFVTAPVVIACPGDVANGLASTIVNQAAVTAFGFTVHCLTSAGSGISGALVRVNYSAEVAR